MTDTILSQAPATDDFAVRVSAVGEQFSATIIRRDGAHMGGVVRRTERDARAAANNMYVNLRTGMVPSRETPAVDLSVARCAWCRKTGKPGRPLLFGRKNLMVHDSCDN